MGLFEGMLVNAGVLVVALLLLDKFSHWTIVNSERVADLTGLGQTAVGFLLLALSTSLPELSVAVFSTQNEEAVGIAIGNVLGSNIVNVCLILGVCILYAAWKNLACLDFLPLVTRQDIKSLQLGLFGASVIPLALIYIGYASRLVGVALLLIFVWNTYQITRSKEGVKDEGALGEEGKKLPRYVGLVVLGALGVVACSYFIVESATYIALSLGVSKLIIGATIVAFGTSVPELATSLEATKSGSISMALGNIVGSGIMNLTLILGTTLVLSNLTVNMTVFTNLAVFSLISNLFLWYFLSGDRICWREGAMLLGLYGLFLASTLTGLVV